MKKTEFDMLCKERVICLDGATGSNLMKAGMPAGACPELWILEHPDILRLLQRRYVEAGADIIYAPTFTANRIKLEEYGIDNRIEEINRQLVALSKEAAGDKALVAGDITMTGRSLAPVGTMQLEELIAVYQEQIRYLADAGVDLLVIETMMSLQETRAAVIAAKEVCELPVMVTLTFEKDHHTLYGTDAQTAAIVMESLGVSAIGANCSTGPEEMVAIVREMQAVCDIPVIAKPNAGMPVLCADGSTDYEMGPEAFADGILTLVKAGASIVGGCCGTAPEYISLLKMKLNTLTPCDLEVIRKKSNEHRKMHYLTSERRTIAFSVDSPFQIIGERINPTGKKKLQAELKEGSMELVATYAQDQETQGASVLDINVGMGGVDEKELMLKAIHEVTMSSSLPVSIDSSHVDIMEQALRAYPGRALMNSISLESAKCEPLLSLAKKYGAMFILLPLSDKGLPENQEEKRQIIEELIDRAHAHGLKDTDYIVDGLVMTVGADKKAAIGTLETIAYCKERGICTTCGLSNISFGLPERSHINANFLTMAIQSGLTMAIANPAQQNLMIAAKASDLLLGKENADIQYIEYMNELNTQNLVDMKDEAAHAVARALNTANTAKQEKERMESQETEMVRPELQAIYDMVLKGRESVIAAKTQELLADGMDAREILDQALMPAINEVGELFDKGKYFLPQLIGSAETMKKSIAVLEPVLAKDQAQETPGTVVIATVQGDIHDIGKNLVALMLRNYGFRVIDLGRDVPGEEIIRVAKEEDADVIALSALMTTTMQQMKMVVELAKTEKLRAKVIVGGAAVTQDYAEDIHADGYSRDAAEAVRLVKQLLGEI